VAMPMMAMPVPPVPVAMMAAMAATTHARHGEAARLTELRPLCHHARFDPVRVRDELGAKSHRVGGAGLACFGHTILGRCCVEADQKCTGRQYQPERETHGTHMVCSPFARLIPAPPHTSGELVVRRWSMPTRRAPIPKMTKDTVKRPSARLQSSSRRPHSVWGGWRDIVPRGLR
jgi:hypothetical protein